MAAGQTIMLRSLLTGDILIYCIKLQSLFKCAVVKLQAHLYLLINVVIAKKVWTVWTNDLKASCWDSTETHAFLLGHLDFPSSNTTNTLTLPASSITNPLRRTQTNNLSSQTAHAAAPTVGQPAAECRPPDLRRLDVSCGPCLPSAWRCTETLPSPLWPSSWRWGRWDCSVAASGPHLRPASADRTDRRIRLFTLKPRCVYFYVTVAAFKVFWGHRFVLVEKCDNPGQFGAVILVLELAMCRLLVAEPII